MMQQAEPYVLACKQILNQLGKELEETKAKLATYEPPAEDTAMADKF